MKSILLSAAILMTILTGNTNSTAAPSYFANDFAKETFSKKRIEISVTIYFGRGANCAGRGICKITIGGSLRAANPSPIETGKATTTFEIVDGKLRASFDKTSMRLQTMCDQFGDGTFAVAQDTPLPSDVAAKLGVRGYLIKAGKYQVADKGRNLVVIF